jgi:uncharacterized protein YraI
MRPVSLMALIALGVALAASPHSASAQSIAYSVPGSTNVRAGPGTQYPVVARVRGGVEILVYGCLSDRAWCDVQVYETRGWMSSRRLEFEYAGSYVPVPEYYAYFDAPIIRFDFGYWDRYYDDRPFYRRWRRHNPPSFEPGEVTNYPGIEHPNAPPQQGPTEPPLAGGYEPPSGGVYGDPSTGAGVDIGPGGVDVAPIPDGGMGVAPGGGGELAPPGAACPPDVICP